MNRIVTPETPARKRFLPIRFSLRTLLLVTVIVALAISHFFTSLRLKKSDQELESLRNETGYLTFSDAKRIQVIEVPTADDLTFRWRVHLPENHHYWAHLVVSDELPHEGLPKGNPGGFGHNLSMPGHPQEFILTLAVRRMDPYDLNKGMILTLFDDNSTGIERSGIGVNREHAEWLNNTSSKIEAGKGTTQSAAQTSR